MTQSDPFLVTIPVDSARLEGSLVVPEAAGGIVLFAHGSGSSRHSPRNNFVAQLLREAGLGTLLMDLLAQAEDADYEAGFNIGLLTQRHIVATRWLLAEPSCSGFRVGYFGASTGAAAALRAAAELKRQISAVVSRGGQAGSRIGSSWGG